MYSWQMILVCLKVIQPCIKEVFLAKGFVKKANLDPKKGLFRVEKLLKQMVY